MEEIRTRIDDVFEFIQERGKTTTREVSRGVRVDGDELDKFLYVLQKNGLIDVKYGLINTYIYSGEETAKWD